MLVNGQLHPDPEVHKAHLELLCKMFPWYSYERTSEDYLYKVKYRRIIIGGKDGGPPQDSIVGDILEAEVDVEVMPTALSGVRRKGKQT